LSEWEKELARIDKQIAATSDEELAARAAATAAAPPGTMPPSAAHGGASPIQPTQAAAPAAPPSSIGATLRLGLSVALAAGMMFWPYEARCGMGLAAYMGAVTVVAGSGIWSAIWSWRHRAGRSQVLSLLVLAWGLVLGGLEILPRTGYALPSEAHPNTWSCRPAEMPGQLPGVR
jgi:hypothetical protein